MRTAMKPWKRSTAAWAVLAGGALAGAGCGGDSGTGPDEEGAAVVSGSVEADAARSAAPALFRRRSLRPVSGDGQAGTVAEPLPEPVVLEVVDAAGSPVAGVDVRFRSGVDGPVADPARATTDEAGRVQVTVTLGPRAGPQEMEASVVRSLVRPVTLAFEGEAGAASRLAVVSGDGQSGEVGFPLPHPVVVLVTDAFANPVGDADVVFTVTAGGGSLDPALVRAGPDGLARALWRLGPVPGEQGMRAELAASVSSAASARQSASAVEIRATALAGPPPADIEGGYAGSGTITRADCGEVPPSGDITAAAAVDPATGALVLTLFDVPVPGTYDRATGSYEGTTRFTASGMTVDEVVTGTWGRVDYATDPRVRFEGTAVLTILTPPYRGCEIHSDLVLVKQ